MVLIGEMNRKNKNGTSALSTPREEMTIRIAKNVKTYVSVKAF